MPALEPMYAATGTSMPTGSGWAYEQKFDGMRVVAVAGTSRVRLLRRNGRNKPAR